MARSTTIALILRNENGTNEKQTHLRATDPAGRLAAPMHGNRLGRSPDCRLVIGAGARSPAPIDDQKINAQRIDCPVLAQSFMNASMPLSVSGCDSSDLIVAGGIVAQSAPASAASLTWFGVRIDAASTCVVSSS